MKPRNLEPRRRGVAAVCLCAAAVSGCGIGPAAMERDRLDYQTALSESWKRQILLNLVRIRYADAPVFLDVTSVISQYSAGGQVSAGATIHNPSWWHEETLGASAAYSDKPTLTYVPMSGEKFARSLFTPLPPTTLVSLVQAGWPVDQVFRLTCSSVNGIRNQSWSPLLGRPEDPRFEELLAALRRIQVEDTIAMRVEKKGSVETAFVSIGMEDSRRRQGDHVRVRELLGLDPAAREFRVVFGVAPSTRTDLALQTRSMCQMLVELGGCIDVPREHIAAGKTIASKDVRGAPPFLRVHSAAARPAHAFVDVRYRGHWYWVDDDDFASKRMLSLMMMFFSLVETSGGAGAPIVTVQAG